MRIVLVCEPVFPENKGGVEKWLSFLSKYLADASHEVIYLNGSLVNEIREKVTYISVSESSWSYDESGTRSIKDSIQFARQVGRWLRENEFDLVYCVQAPIFPIFTASFVVRAKRKGILVEWIEVWPFRYWQRYIGTVKGLIGWLIQKISLKFGDYRLAFTRDVLMKLGRSAKLLPGLVSPISDFKRPALTKRDEISFIGRFVPEKQPIFALEIFIELCRRGWKGKINIFGQGPMLNELLEFKARSRFSDQIQIVPNASDQELKAALERSFLLLHPSRREGYGLVVVEAAASGVPTLLINYPENLAVDLEINPELVCQDDDLATICEAIYSAHDAQMSHSSKALDWIESKANSHSMLASARQIEKLAVEILLN